MAGARHQIVNLPIGLGDSPRLLAEHADDAGRPVLPLGEQDRPVGRNGESGSNGEAGLRAQVTSLANKVETLEGKLKGITNTDLTGVLAGASGALLIDGISTWLAAAMDECGTWDGSAQGAARLAGRIGGLAGAWRQTRARVVARVRDGVDFAGGKGLNARVGGFGTVVVRVKGRVVRRPPGG